MQFDERKLEDDGSVFSWGSNRGGRLGHKIESEVETIPRIITALSKARIKSIACGDWHCAAITGLDDYRSVSQ
jgi:alpha-tubulin suppressor-like RCC1 family protein